MPIDFENAPTVSGGSRGLRLLHPSGNPYGFIDADAEERIAEEIQSRDAKSTAPKNHSQGELKLFSDSGVTERPASAGASSTTWSPQHPYASLSLNPDTEDDSLNSGDDLDDSASARDSWAAHSERGVSIELFRRGCRAILLKYEPLSSERSRLRPEFAHFISVNQAKPAKVRAAILSELEKYRIKHSLKPHLNRERIDSVVKKLQDITNSFQ